MFNNRFKSVCLACLLGDNPYNKKTSKGLCLFIYWPMSDTGQAGDRVASEYCQRCDSFAADGIVSGSRRNMAEMFGTISDDF